MLNFAKTLMLVAACSIGAPGVAAAADPADAIHVEPYLFRVNCPAEHYVAQWTPGPAGPGKSYFRIATGDANSDCSVYDYNPYTDAGLPRRECPDPGGIVRGFPVFLIPLGATHCH